MFAAVLSNRAIVAVGGADARAFLDRLLTNSMASVSPTRACYAALLAPQGKMVAELFVTELPAEEGQGFLLDVARPQAEELVEKLNFYRLRAAVSIEQIGPAASVVALWGEGAPGALAVAVADPRLPALGFRAALDSEGLAATLAKAGATLVEERAWHDHRIALGIAEAGADYIVSETFPHEANLDQLGGIDFAKGCFVGQEVVSRMQHRGTARARVVPVERIGEGSLGEAGLPVLAGERRIGVMGSSSGSRGLALIRLDRAADARAAGQALMCGGVPLRLVKPTWARFAIPEDAAAVP